MEKIAFFGISNITRVHPSDFFSNYLFINPAIRLLFLFVNNAILARVEHR